jgi:BMFP domain-containing protein YqiC
MQTRGRVFDDMARLANGAVGALAGAGRELEALIRAQIEKLLANMDLVRRDEFEAVKAMAAKARAEQERLEARLAALEAKLAGDNPQQN